MDAPLAEQQLAEASDLHEHDDAVVDKEDRDEPDQHVTQVQSHPGADEAVEQQQKDAEEVGDELVEDVLVVDDRVFPRMLGHRESYHGDGSREQDPHAEQRVGAEQHDCKGIEYPSKREH